jgi:hypothetical protein
LRFAKRRAEENAHALAIKSEALQEEINKRRITEKEKEGLLRKLVNLQELESVLPLLKVEFPLIRLT